jgi:hypothetical protein
MLSRRTRLPAVDRSASSIGRGLKPRRPLAFRFEHAVDVPVAAADGNQTTT